MHSCSQRRYCRAEIKARPIAGNTKTEIDEAHHTLADWLEKPERRLVLKIIDGKDWITEDLSEDSFISEFQLAWQLGK